jgi:hypothetical protein
MAVRPVPIAIALSMVVHTAAIAWVRNRPDPRPVPAAARALATAADVVAAPNPASEPIEITLLPDDTVPATPAATVSHMVSPRAPSTVPRPAALATTTTPTTTATRSPAATEPTPHPTEHHSPWMTMRQPAVEHGVSTAFVDDLLAHSRPLAKPEIDGERIDADVAHDRAQLGDPRWVAAATPDELRLAREHLAVHRDEQAAHELHPSGGGTYQANHQTFDVKVAADGTAKIDDRANLQRHGLGLSFDVTDGLMRSHGIDPYASYKLKVLDETRDERVAIGNRYRKQQLAKSNQLMQRNLARLWATTADLSARKRGVFQLWDECAEHGSDDVIAGGAMARTYLIGFVRTRLARDSAMAFTAAELAELNAHRQSSATFAPYE